jgi:hypothetical protein
MSELERAYNIRDIRMFGLNIDPTLDPVRNLPGFKMLKKKMNLN